MPAGSLRVTMNSALVFLTRFAELLRRVFMVGVPPDCLSLDCSRQPISFPASAAEAMAMRERSFTSLPSHSSTALLNGEPRSISLVLVSSICRPILQRVLNTRSLVHRRLLCCFLSLL